MNIPADTTSYILPIFIQDITKTDSSGLTGLVYNSAGLFATYYRTNAGASVGIPLVTMTLGTWVSGGFKEVNSTLMPGWYVLSLPNDVLVTGVTAVAVHLFGASSMSHIPVRIELTGMAAIDYDAVKAKLVEALATDTYAEPAQITPPATTTLERKLAHLYKAWRNKADQGPEIYKLYNDDGTTVGQKHTITKTATGLSKSEKVTGP